MAPKRVGNTAENLISSAIDLQNACKKYLNTYSNDQTESERKFADELIETANKILSSDSFKNLDQVKGPDMEQRAQDMAKDINSISVSIPGTKFVVSGLGTIIAANMLTRGYTAAQVTGMLKSNAFMKTYGKPNQASMQDAMERIGGETLDMDYFLQNSEARSLMEQEATIRSFEGQTVQAERPLVSFKEAELMEEIAASQEQRIAENTAEELAKPVEQSKPQTESAKPVEQPKPQTESAKPVEQSKPQAEPAKPSTASEELAKRFDKALLNEFKWQQPGKKARQSTYSSVALNGNSNTKGINDIIKTHSGEAANALRNNIAGAQNLAGKTMAELITADLLVNDIIAKDYLKMPEGSVMKTLQSIKAETPEARFNELVNKVSQLDAVQPFLSGEPGKIQEFFRTRTEIANKINKDWSLRTNMETLAAGQKSLYSEFAGTPKRTVRGRNVYETAAQAINARAAGVMDRISQRINGGESVEAVGKSMSATEIATITAANLMNDRLKVDGLNEVREYAESVGSRAFITQLSKISEIRRFGKNIESAEQFYNSLASPAESFKLSNAAIKNVLKSDSYTNWKNVQMANSMSTRLSSLSGEVLNARPDGVELRDYISAGSIAAGSLKLKLQNGNGEPASLAETGRFYTLSGANDLTMMTNMVGSTLLAAELRTNPNGPLNSKYTEFVNQFNKSFAENPNTNFSVKSEFNKYLRELQPVKEFLNGLNPDTLQDFLATEGRQLASEVNREIKLASESAERRAAEQVSRPAQQPVQPARPQTLNEKLKSYQDFMAQYPNNFAPKHAEYLNNAIEGVSNLGNGLPQGSVIDNLVAAELAVRGASLKQINEALNHRYVQNLKGNLTQERFNDFLGKIGTADSLAASTMREINSIKTEGKYPEDFLKEINLKSPAYDLSVPPMNLFRPSAADMKMGQPQKPAEQPKPQAEPLAIKAANAINNNINGRTTSLLNQGKITVAEENYLKAGGAAATKISEAFNPAKATGKNTVESRVNKALDMTNPKRVEALATVAGATMLYTEAVEMGAQGPLHDAFLKGGATGLTNYVKSLDSFKQLTNNLDAKKFEDFLVDQGRGLYQQVKAELNAPKAEVKPVEQPKPAEPVKPVEAEVVQPNPFEAEITNNILNSGVVEGNTLEYSGIGYRTIGGEYKPLKSAAEMMSAGEPVVVVNNGEYVKTLRPGANGGAEIAQPESFNGFEGTTAQNSFERLYRIMDGADSALMKSSPEFRNMKTMLDKMRQNPIAEPTEVYESMQYISGQASKYVQEKLAQGKNIKKTTQGRLNAVTEVYDIINANMGAALEAASPQYEMAALKEEAARLREGVDPFESSLSNFTKSLERRLDVKPFNEGNTSRVLNDTMSSSRIAMASPNPTEVLRANIAKYAASTLIIREAMAPGKMKPMTEKLQELGPEKFYEEIQKTDSFRKMSMEFGQGINTAGIEHFFNTGGKEFFDNYARELGIDYKLGKQGESIDARTTQLRQVLQTLHNNLATPPSNFKSTLTNNMTFAKAGDAVRAMTGNPTSEVILRNLPDALTGALLVYEADLKEKPIEDTINKHELNADGEIVKRGNEILREEILQSDTYKEIVESIQSDALEGLKATLEAGGAYYNKLYSELYTNKLNKSAEQGKQVEDEKPAEEPVKELAEEPVKESAEEPVKELAEEAEPKLNEAEIDPPRPLEELPKFEGFSGEAAQYAFEDLETILDEAEPDLFKKNVQLKNMKAEFGKMSRNRNITPQESFESIQRIAELGAKLPQNIRNVKPVAEVLNVITDQYPKAEQASLKAEEAGREMKAFEADLPTLGNTFAGVVNQILDAQETAGTNRISDNARSMLREAAETATELAKAPTAKPNAVQLCDLATAAVLIHEMKTVPEQSGRYCNRFTESGMRNFREAIENSSAFKEMAKNVSEGSVKQLRDIFGLNGQELYKSTMSEVIEPKLKQAQEKAEMQKTATDLTKSLMNKTLGTSFNGNKMILDAVKASRRLQASMNAQTASEVLPELVAGTLLAREASNADGPLKNIVEGQGPEEFLNKVKGSDSFKQLMNSVKNGSPKELQEFMKTGGKELYKNFAKEMGIEAKTPDKIKAEAKEGPKENTNVKAPTNPGPKFVL